METTYQYIRGSETHTLLLPLGMKIRLCKTEGEAQDCVNYYFYKLGIDANYLSTNWKPSMYAWSNPVDIDFILFDNKNDMILEPIDCKDLNDFFESVKSSPTQSVNGNNIGISL